MKTDHKNCHLNFYCLFLLVKCLIFFSSGLLILKTTIIKAGRRAQWEKGYLACIRLQSPFLVRGAKGVIWIHRVGMSFTEV